MNTRLSELVVVDDVHNVVRINGAAVDGEVFRQLAVPTPPGRWYRTVSVGDTIVVQAIEISPISPEATPI